MVEAASGFRHTAHNSTFDLLLLYTLPNGLWIALPALIVASLTRRAKPKHE